MTLIPGVASARALVVNEIGKTCDMQVLVLGRHWRSGRGRTAGDRSGTDGRRGIARRRRIFSILRLRNVIFLFLKGIQVFLNQNLKKFPPAAGCFPRTGEGVSLISIEMTGENRVVGG